MGRPDINGTVIDDVGGKPNGTANEINEETDDTLNEPGTDPNLDGGTEDSEVGEDVGAEENPVDGENENPEPGQPATISEEVKEELRNQLRDELRNEMREANPPPPPPPITEEEWAKHEASWGVPRTAITNTVERIERVANHIMSKVDERFAKFEKAETLRTIAREPGFSDANRYQKDVDEYLSHYPAKHHSNPEILKRGIIYARGKNMKTAMNKVRNGTERNLRIAAPGGRPAAGGAPVRPGSKVALNPSQRSAARAFGMTDQEYIAAGAKKQLT